MSVRGTPPDPAAVDWQKALTALYDAASKAPVKQHDRTPEQQAAVEQFTRRMVQVSELLHGAELGLMDLPLEDECSAREFYR